MAQVYTTVSAVLTTVFTPPASCSSSWTYEDESFNAVSRGLLIQNDLTIFDTNCWPASFTGNGRANGRVSSPVQIYSPGVCLSGYTNGAGYMGSISTRGICCPSGFEYTTDYSSMNYHTFSVLFQGCISTYPLAYGSTVVPGRVSPDGLSMTTVTGPLTMWAQPLYVEYQETDLSLFSTTSTNAPTSSTAQPSSTNSAPSSNTAAASSPIPTEIHNDALSTSAKAGIGVGAVVGSLLLVALLSFCMRRRITSRSRAKHTMETPSWSWERKELDASGARKEIDSSPLENELDASDARKELEGSTLRNELETSGPRRELDSSAFKSRKQIIAQKPIAQTIVELE